jgi:hypothetical protein
MPSKSKKAAASSTARKPSKAKSHARTARATSKPGTGNRTKHGRILAMLRRPAGATIASLMAATEWQQHSVRGFLAGVVRKKLGLDLVSEQTDKGRIYWIKNTDAAPAATERNKKAA